MKIPLGIFIPAYNEEHRFPYAEIERFLSSDEHDKNSYNLVFVNDGSVDNTKFILKELKDQYPQNIRIIELIKNQGKGEAIRQAFVKCKEEFELLGYLDCDMATPIEEFYAMGVDALKKNKEIYFGSRIQKVGSRVERKVIRHYLGRIFATCASFILNVPIYDTQCGAKYFHYSLVNDIFTDKFISKWLFDVELFARVLSTKGQAYFNDKAFEKPLETWLEKGGSKIKLKDMFLFPLELIKIGARYRNKLKK